MLATKYFCILAIILSIGALKTVQAAGTTASINITGIIEPAACNVTVQGNVDFGRLKRADLDKRTDNGLIALPNKTVAFLIACDGKTSTGITFEATALETDIAAKIGRTGYVGALKAGSTNVGVYTISVGNITLDSTPAILLNKKSASADYLRKQDKALALDKTEILSWAKNGIKPEPAKRVNGTLSVDVLLLENEVTRLRDQITFRGTTVIALQYL